MSAPTEIRAGDSVAWYDTHPAYIPTDGWTLRFRMIWPTGTPVAFDAAADGSDYLVSLTAATTSSWTAGTATLVSWVERGAGASLERVTLEQSQVSILPDLTAATTFDGRSENEKALADAKAALAAYMASGRLHVAAYDIAGRKMQFRSADEISALVDHYERACATDRALLAILNGGSPGRVIVRM